MRLWHIRPKPKLNMAAMKAPDLREISDRGLCYALRKMTEFRNKSRNLLKGGVSLAKR